MKGWRPRLENPGSATGTCKKAKEQDIDTDIWCL